jgi:dihydroorotase
MTILIRQARIVDRESPHHGQKTDILIRDGRIEKIGDLKAEKADQTIETPGLHVSPGWVETFADGGEPGHEQRETLETAAQAAAAGGFTNLFVLPDTKPAVHDRSLVSYIREKNVTPPVTLHPIGAVTRDTAGKELAEMYDMREAGAIAFSDGHHPVQSAGLLIKALQYLKTFDGVLIQVPDDHSVAPHGLMHEGVVSTRLGLAGKPALAEELIIARDIKLARYAESRIHFTGVSLPKSIEYISRAKQGGIDVTCAVTPQHLYFCDADLEGYDTRLRIDPPLRTASDREALRAAVLDGRVDCVSSHHQPHELDRKACEFAYASPGMTGLETCFGALGAVGVPAERIVELLSLNPRNIFGLPAATVREGSESDLTLFDPDTRYVFTREQIRSRSSNTPFLGKELKGKVIGILNRGRWMAAP